MLEKKATEEEIHAAFMVLANGLKSQFSDQKSMAVAYFYALNGVSSWALKQAMDDVFKGKAEGLNPTFMPSAPEFYSYCERLEDNVRVKADSIILSLNKPEVKPQGKLMSDEKFAELMRQMKEMFGGPKSDSGAEKNV
ncbi:hypothetical protein [Bartonella rattaustraliani]|uniref:hypothetical protein n=1 Tax=Bartonella rattaustraliani TaxID=481139 RepID=UPI0002F407CE|nr:hypothetical protein [Bartonella rattaustraliani]